MWRLCPAPPRWWWWGRGRSWTCSVRAPPPTSGATGPTTPQSTPPPPTRVAGRGGRRQCGASSGGSQAPGVASMWREHLWSSGGLGNVISQILMWWHLTIWGRAFVLTLLFYPSSITKVSVNVWTNIEHLYAIRYDAHIWYKTYWYYMFNCSVVKLFSFLVLRLFDCLIV